MPTVIPCSLTFSHSGFFVPYWREDDGQSHPYVNLKQHPELADQLPERQRDEDLKRFVLAINGETWYDTIGCEFPISEREFKFFKRGYVQVCFVDREQASHGGYIPQVFWGMCSALKDYDRETCSFFVEMVQSNVEFEGIAKGCWTIDFWISSRADTLEAANGAWRDACEIVLGVLRDTPPVGLSIAAMYPWLHGLPSFGTGHRGAAIGPILTN